MKKMFGEFDEINGQFVLATLISESDKETHCMVKLDALRRTG